MILRDLGLMAWRDRDSLEAHRDRLLAELVRHARATVPFYHELYRDIPAAESLRGMADLPALPFTDKALLRSRPEAALLAEDVGRSALRRNQTTGSSGVPFAMYRTDTERRRQQRFWLRAHHALGQRPGDRLVRIMAMRNPPRRRPFGLDTALETIGLKTGLLDVSQDQEALLARLRAMRPAIVGGYPGMLALLGQRIEDSGRRDLRPRFLIAGGEVMTPARRRQIERTWAAPVHQVYGCWEAGLLAWECRASGLLHLCEDSVVIELLRDGRPVAEGERGEVVLTSLHSRAMPFIRYRLGDMATRGPSLCPCGQPFATISAIQGRMLDFFRLPSGRLVHPYEIMLGVRDDRWIGQYQMVQDREDLIRFNFVPGLEFAPDRLADFEKCAAGVLGDEARLEVRMLPRIEPAPGGKFHLARSLVTDAEDWHRSATVG